MVGRASRRVLSQHQGTVFRACALPQVFPLQRTPWPACLAAGVPSGRRTYRYAAHPDGRGRDGQARPAGSQAALT